jgi:hypothetical protein
MGQQNADLWESLSNCRHMEQLLPDLRSVPVAQYPL